MDGDGMGPMNPFGLCIFSFAIAFLLFYWHSQRETYKKQEQISLFKEEY